MIIIHSWYKKLHVNWCEFTLDLYSRGYSWRSFSKILCNDARERLCFWEHFRRDSFQQNLSIVWTSCCKVPGRSGIFYLLVDVVYWSCGFKFVYPTINMAFLGINVKVKLTAKFRLHSFEWFCLWISDAEYLSCLA